jgi:hypothetical protein
MTCAESTGTKKLEGNAGTRAYVLLRATANHRKQAIRILERQAGVVAVDLVEGPPDIVLVIEAPDRRRLASVLVNAMASVQNVTDGVELLPAQHRRRGRPNS